MSREWSSDRAATPEWADFQHLLFVVLLHVPVGSTQALLVGHQLQQFRIVLGSRQGTGTGLNLSFGMRE